MAINSSANQFNDGFPNSPLEAVNFSYFLSESEKQEWREWIKTATLDQQNELVEILHAMWQDNQKNAVPENFANAQAENNTFKQALDSDTKSSSQAQTVEASQPVSTFSNSPSRQSLPAFPTPETPPFDYTQSTPVNSTVTDQQTSFTPATNLKPNIFPDNESLSKTPKTKNNLNFSEFNPNDALPRTQSIPKPFSPEGKLEVIPPSEISNFDSSTSSTNSSTASTANLDYSFADEIKKAASASSQPSKEKEQLPQNISTSSLSATPVVADTKPANQDYAYPPKEEKIDMSSLMKEGKYSPNPLLVEDEKLELKTQEESLPKVKEPVEEIKSQNNIPVKHFDFDVAKQRKAKLALKEIHEEYSKTKKIQEEYTKLLEKVATVLESYDEVEEMFKAMMERLLILNDAVKNIRARQSKLRSNLNDNSLKDEIKEIKVDLNKLDAEFKDYRSSSRREIRDLMASVEATSGDVFGSSNSNEQKIHLLTSRIEKIERSLGQKSKRNLNNDENFDDFDDYKDVKDKKK